MTFPLSLAATESHNWPAISTATFLAVEKRPAQGGGGWRWMVRFMYRGQAQQLSSKTVAQYHLGHMTGTHQSDAPSFCQAEPHSIFMVMVFPLRILEDAADSSRRGLLWAAALALNSSQSSLLALTLSSVQWMQRTLVSPWTLCQVRERGRDSELLPTATACYIHTYLSYAIHEQTGLVVTADW